MNSPQRIVFISDHYFLHFLAPLLKAIRQSLQLFKLAGLEASDDVFGFAETGLVGVETAIVAQVNARGDLLFTGI